MPDPNLKHSYSKLKLASPLDIYHLGPELHYEPMPAFIYFALSGEESLTLDPFNQPAVFLEEKPIRIFSFTLPYHGDGYDKKNALNFWAEELNAGKNIIQDFVEGVSKSISLLIEKGYIDPEAIAAGGLSRGAFIATHLAAYDERVKIVLGFSPLTDLTYTEEFTRLTQNSLIDSLNLERITQKLTYKKVRFYIGNRDTRVGTKHCFSFIENLTETNYKQGNRSVPCELNIFPSIGHKGHGTPPQIFEEGVKWLFKQLDERFYGSPKQAQGN